MHGIKYTDGVATDWTTHYTGLVEIRVRLTGVSASGEPGRGSESEGRCPRGAAAANIDSTRNVT